MRGLAAAVVLVILAAVPVAEAQSVSVELDQTVGQTSEDVTAAATQVRAFGELAEHVRFTVEGAWATRSAERGDAFEAAYPYGGRVQTIEAYGERLFEPGHGILAVRAGRYRTPFGIYEGSDQGYFGFLRAPLIRYDGSFALSNTLLEEGLDVVVGSPTRSFEASVGKPGDVSAQSRRPGVDTVVRAQGAFGPLILGASYIDTEPAFPALFASGRTRFQGIDARWMRDGLQWRGEWLWGRPFDGTTTDGGYVDLIVHRPAMGPFTAFGRAERLTYDAPAPFAVAYARYTAGGRIRMFDRLTLSADVISQTRDLPNGHRVALDVGLTYAVRHDLVH